MVNGDNPAIKANIIRQIETDGKADLSKEDYEANTSGASNAFNVYSTVAGLSMK